MISLSMRASSVRWLLASLLICHAPALRAANAADPARFEKAILEFEAADKDTPPAKGGTLFVGASNIRRWESLPKRFKNAINRGFGGSHLSDVAFYFERIVTPYTPKTIYLNAGGNDLHSGRTPEDVLAAFEAFVKKARTAVPKAKLAFISIPTSPARWNEVADVRRANDLISAWIARDGASIDYIDVISLLLGPDGQPRPELYVDDRLHFSEAGYDIMASAIKWQGAINAHIKSDATAPPPANPIVFVGSSSIVRWKSLAQDFPGLPVMNRGFGGSEMFDSLNYAHRVIIPYRPRQVIVYAGGNDLNAGKTPERVIADFKSLVARIHIDLPDTRISVISIAGNPKRWAQVDKVRSTNQMLEEFTKTDPRLRFINVFPKMMGANGMPLPDIFVADQLHMNEKGYVIWTEVVRPYLK